MKLIFNLRSTMERREKTYLHIFFSYRASVFSQLISAQCQTWQHRAARPSWPSPVLCVLGTDSQDKLDVVWRQKEHSIVSMSNSDIVLFQDCSCLAFFF